MDTEIETMTGAEIYLQITTLREMREDAYNVWHAASVAYGEMPAVLPDETERARCSQSGSCSRSATPSSATRSAQRRIGS